MPWRAQNSLANALEPSRRAAAARGPNAGMPAASSWSTRPSTSGSSGPGTTSSIPASRQKATMPSTSSRASGTQVASRAIASLPGAQYNRSTRGDAASAQHSACSRPPAPTTRTFMPTPRRDRAVRGCSRLPGEDNSTACGSDRACGRDRDPLRAVLRDEPQVPGQIKSVGAPWAGNYLRSRQGLGTNQSLPSLSSHTGAMRDPGRGLGSKPEMAGSARGP